MGPAHNGEDMRKPGLNRLVSLYVIFVLPGGGTVGHYVWFKRGNSV